MKKNILIALLFIGGLTACNDNDNEQPKNLESVNIFVCSDELAIPNALGYPITNFSQIKSSQFRMYGFLAYTCLGLPKCSMAPKKLFIMTS